MEVAYELFQTVNDEIGFMSQVKLNGDYNLDDFFMINMKKTPLKIEASTFNIYDKLFKKYNMNCPI